ncbi:MAG: hydrogenase expression/formation protein HypE [Candidatus Thermoplasmatota archaeon]|nr:hydrogenase expression/formation protein HypE [Candidatus Thermoplasmatota archaeon]
MTCPTPISNYERVLLGHGGGGRLTNDLVRQVFVPLFDNKYLAAMDDQAVIEVNGARLAFTTDSFVVSPLFFPGGNVGSLAINGTINDLAVCGARPLYLSAALIMEEGLPMEELQRIGESMKGACEEAGVLLVTGDTKVVERGKGDGIFITTTGVGLVPDGVNVSSRNAKPGDKIILSGELGIHGIVIMSVREGIQFETQLESDSAPLHTLVEAILSVTRDVHCMRDPTRGGLASALNELASSSKVGMKIQEVDIPIPEEVEGACEILGLDPLVVANEGKLVAMVPPSTADEVVTKMRNHPLGREARVIGEVVEDHPGTVVMETSIGGLQIVQMPSGEQLPRIC